MATRTAQEKETAHTSRSAGNTGAPEPYLIISNISKKPNIKSLMKNAVAFGVKTIYVAGQKKFHFNGRASVESSSSHHHQDEQKEEKEKSDVPTVLRPMIQSGQVQIIQYDKLQDCIEHLHTLGIKVMGVEIDPSALDVEDTDKCFECAGGGGGNSSSRGASGIAFMMGNEGTGMNQKQMSLCDGFVKISQYGGGTASLNVSVAAAIVLQRFYAWSRKSSSKADHKVEKEVTS
jgi:rRNA methylases